MRIGVDVGGTNTDAVLMQGRTVLATYKSPTTESVSDGIVAAINHILEESGKKARDIRSVMIGTTQFTNSFVERRNLLPVGVIRLALPATKSLPPLIDWPKDLAQEIGSHAFLVKGGYEFDGRPISNLDHGEIEEVVKELAGRGIRAFAISGVFSPVNSEMEERAADIVRHICPEAALTLSSKIGRISLLERENAAIMNASLADLAETVVSSFSKALVELNIDAPFYVSQNDGTLMTAEAAKEYPVLTFASGPTNSMRGAAYLSGIKDALVADIGGTTTDIGILSNGFPRESTTTVDIGGVRTNFRMPDILSLGLGGGSYVSSGLPVAIGPKSVGFRLTDRARVFGGDTLTATDIAVAAGYASIGDASRVKDLPMSFVESSVVRIHEIVADGVDRMRSSATVLPLILVGGGSVLINRDIRGVSEIVVPENASVANAIGASIAQVGAEIDKVYPYADKGREASLAEATEQATSAAVRAGADPATVKVIDFEEVPLSYVPGNAVRVRVKVAGDLPNAHKSN